MRIRLGFFHSKMAQYDHSFGLRSPRNTTPEGNDTFAKTRSLPFGTCTPKTLPKRLNNIRHKPSGACSKTLSGGAAQDATPSRALPCFYKRNQNNRENSFWGSLLENPS